MSNFNLGAALQQFKENSELHILAPGTYTLECTSATAGTSKTDQPKITPVFKVVGGPDAGKRVMAGQLSFAENALWKTIPALRGFGITDDFLQQANSQPDPIKTVADAMVGRVVEAAVSVKVWQGEERNELGKVSVADGSPAASPSPPQPQASAPTGDASRAPNF